MVLEDNYFEQLKDRLLTAFVEEREDIITLVTVLDLYSEEVNTKGSPEQKGDYLNTVLGLLQQNKDIVKEIGWDLPKIIIKFIHWSNINYENLVHDNVILHATMKCFNEIALFGNAKECFFTGCELVSSLSLADDSLVKFTVPADADAIGTQSDDETATETDGDETEGGEQDDSEEELERDASNDSPEDAHLDLEKGAEFFNRQPQEFILELRFHVLIELINSTLKRITTLYPSRFLSEAVQALIKFVSQNSVDLDDTMFVLRRIYSFVRGYIPPHTPENAAELATPKELTDIQNFEQAMQRKLICSLLTTSLGQLLKHKNTMCMLRFYNHIQNSGKQVQVTDYYEALSETLSRYYQISSSFDIDIATEFKRLCVDESKRIYRSLPKDSEVTSEEELKEINQLVYQLAYTYEMEKAANVKEILLDPAGILCLASMTEDDLLPPENMKISVDEAIYMYLRFVTPSMYSVLFENVTTSDLSRMWLLCAFVNNSSQDTTEALSKMPSYVISAYLQIELTRSCHQVNDENRRVQFSLITRVLCSMNENNAFSFIKDTLLSCPYEHAKCCILAILKDLMIRERKMTDIKEENQLTDNMSKLELKEKPELPSRPFILINEDRMAAVHTLSLMNIDQCVAKPEPAKLKTLLMYLNFYNSLLQKWDKFFLAEVCDKINEKILIPDNLANNSEPQYGFIKISVDSIKSKL